MATLTVGNGLFEAHVGITVSVHDVLNAIATVGVYDAVTHNGTIVSVTERSCPAPVVGTLLAVVHVGVVVIVNVWITDIAGAIDATAMQLGTTTSVR